jgi:hypothetical protein
MKKNNNDSKNQKNYLIIKKLSNNFKKIISRKKIKKYNLDNGNNGIGDRFCNKKFNYSVIYHNGSFKNYSENEYENIKYSKIKSFLNKNKNKNKKGIIGIFIHSIRKNIFKRPIRIDIRNYFKNKNCVHCGSSNNLVVDHKNDLYNDDRVLNSKTQLIDDFQSLCNHCNLLKRQICKNEKKVLKLYSAKNLDKYKYIHFIIPWEMVYYDINDKNIKNDSYWYDPIEFQNKLYKYIIYIIPLLKEIKNKIKLFN